MLDRTKQFVATGKYAEAVPELTRIVKAKPNDPEVHNLLGICFLSLGRLSESEVAFRTSISLNPNSAASFANLGLALRIQNRGEEALAAFQKAVELEPEHPRNFLQLFKQLQQLTLWDDSILCLRKGLAMHPGSILLSEALALAYGRLNRSEEAEKVFAGIFTHSVAAANSYAKWLQEEGRFADSAAVLEHSLRLQPVQGAPYLSLVESKQTELGNKPILGMAQALLANTKIDDSGRMYLHYAVGKLLDQEQRFEGAIREFDAANSIAYQIYPVCKTFDPAWTIREPELIAQLFSDQFLERVAELGTPDDRPIFIVGMIRSGTTLLDQIVTSHPEVNSVGEGTFWNSVADSIHPKWRSMPPDGSELLSLAHRYLESVGRNEISGRFTDKMPLNYRSLGLIRSVFPRAQILHIRRDPFDTCLSIYSTFFGGGPNFVYHRQNIASFYAAYQHTMDHWRATLPKNCMLEIEYEQLVSQPAEQIQKIIQFLNLPWSESCLRHDSNKTQVSTPSRWQARQPIYGSSVGKRSAYEKYCDEFAKLKSAHPTPTGSGE